MTEKNPETLDGQVKEKKGVLEYMTPAGKFSLLLLFFATGLILANLIGVLAILPFLDLSGGDFSSIMKQLSNYSDKNVVKGLKIAQVISAVGTFIVPAAVFVFLVSGKRKEYLRVNFFPLPVSMLICLLIMLSAQPLINITAEWNEMLRFPEFMSDLEKWMKESEAGAAAVTKAFLQMGNTGDLVINILIMAVLAAVGEELFFRGCVQRVLVSWTKNVHAGIWIAAAIFSFLHFQFYGFLPRMLIGAVLGYMFYWSGSLWLPILGHFLNNGLAVVLSYLVQKKVLPEQVEELGSGDEQYFLLLSSVLLLTMWLLLMYRFERGRIKKLQS